MDESVVQNLVALGNPEDKVRLALSLAHGDVGKALTYIVQGFPSNSQNEASEPEQEEDEEQEEEKKTVSGVKCKCGEWLERRTVTDSFVWCDKCNDLRKQNEVMLSCPKGTESPLHKSGYDLCLKCAEDVDVETAASVHPANAATTASTTTTGTTEKATAMAPASTTATDTTHDSTNGFKTDSMVRDMQNMSVTQSPHNHHEAKQNDNDHHYNYYQDGNDNDNQLYVQPARHHKHSIAYEWQWSSYNYGWHRYDANINDILNRLAVGKSVQVSIRGNVYHLSKFDDRTALQKNPETGKTRKIRRIEVNENVHQTHMHDPRKQQAAEKAIMEIMNCTQSEAQHALRVAHQNEDAAVNYLIEQNLNGHSRSTQSRAQHKHHNNHRGQHAHHNYHSSYHQRQQHGHHHHQSHSKQSTQKHKQSNQAYKSIFCADSDADENLVADIYGYSDDEENREQNPYEKKKDEKDNTEHREHDAAVQALDRSNEVLKDEQSANDHEEQEADAQTAAAQAALSRYNAMNASVHSSHEEERHDIDGVADKEENDDAQNMSGHSENKHEDKSKHAKSLNDKQKENDNGDLDIYGYSDDEDEEEEEVHARDEDDEKAPETAV